MAESTTPEGIPPCQWRYQNNESEPTCYQVYSLLKTKVDLDKCTVNLEACKHCSTLKAMPNEVVASMAFKAARENLPQQEQADALLTVQPLLKRHTAPAAPPATADKLPCVYRGDKLRQVTCELCGRKGEMVDVYACNDPESDKRECSVNRWSPDPRKQPSKSCVGCSHRKPPDGEPGSQPEQQTPQPVTIIPQGNQPQAESSQSDRPCKLTIGMATYDDEPGVFMTVESLRLYHSDILKETNAEILIVDSNPESKHGKEVRKLCEHWSGGILRYVPAGFAKGTSAPRDLVFREARGEIVLCIDCHVMLVPGALESLLQYFADNPDSPDLVHGPMLHHGCEVYATQMRIEWGEDLMWGKWDLDQAALEDGKPFEIPAHGMGLFACRKLAWRGFNPAFQGFGGEEVQYHEKVRAAGGKAVCLPELKWLHKFSRVDGVPYTLRLEDRFRNYLIGHMELGRDIKPVLQRFAGKLPGESYARIVAETVGMYSGTVGVNGGVV